MKGKHLYNESLSLRLLNNEKDVKMKKLNKGVSHTSSEVQRKKCTRVHCLVLKKNPNYDLRIFFFFYEDDIQLQFQIQMPLPPPGTIICYNSTTMLT